MNPTPAEKIAAAKARMVELAAKFVERSVGEVDGMRASLDRLSAGALDALDEIRHVAHRICGTGATLGFESLSDQARSIEKIADAQTKYGLPDAESLAQLGAGIEAMRAELERQRRAAI